MTHQDRHLRELADDFETDWLGKDVNPGRPDTQRVSAETSKIRAQLFGKGPGENAGRASSARRDHGGKRVRWN